MEENSKYQTYVFTQWKNAHKAKWLSVKKGLVSFGKIIWETKWEKIKLWPQFYQELSTINATFHEGESTIDFKCISNLLDLVS